MMSELEYGLARGYHADLQAVADHSQGIIDRQSAQIAQLQRQLAASRAETEAEKGKRRLAEFKLARASN